MTVSRFYSKSTRSRRVRRRGSPSSGRRLKLCWAGHVLLFDEIHASLHPRLSTRLIELFQDPQTNPHNAQLIFTSSRHVAPQRPEP